MMMPRVTSLLVCSSFEELQVAVAYFWGEGEFGVDLDHVVSENSIKLETQVFAGLFYNVRPTLRGDFRAK